MDLEYKPIVGEVDAGWEPAPGLIMVDFVGHVNQPGFFRCQLLRDLAGFFQSVMSRMGGMAEPIQNQDVESFQLLHARIGNVVNVRDVCKGPNAVTIDRQLSVHDRNRYELQVYDFKRALHGKELSPGNTGVDLGTEHVAKCQADLVQGKAIAVYRHRFTGPDGEGKDVVQSQNVVHVTVRQDHGIEFGNPVTQHLSPEIRGSIYDDRGL